MKSLKRILFSRYAVAVTLVIITVVFLVLFPLRSQVLSSKKEYLLSEARTIAALFRPYYLEGKLPEIRRLAEELGGETGLGVTVTDPGGKVLVQTALPVVPGEREGESPELESALEGMPRVELRDSATTGETYIFAAAPVMVHDRVIGAVRVAVREGSLTPVISPNWPLMGAGLAFLLLLLLGVTFWIQRTLLSDLKEIGSGMGRIVVEGELDRMPRPRVREFHELAGDLEVIASRVKENYRLLEGERDRLEAILVNINTGIIVVEATGRIVLINPVAEKMLGTDRERALGRTLAEVNPARSIDSAVERSRAGFEVSDEVRISIPADRTLKLLASPVRSSDGTVAGSVCVLEDVTATRRLERMRQDFVANVSHELRTPAASVIATVDALKAGAAEDPEVSRRFIDNLARESQRLGGIIEDLLALSRLESDEFVLKSAPFSLTGLVGEVLVEKGELAASCGVTLHLKEVEAELEAEGDRRLVKTALGNLVENAIKYNRPGGEVTVTLESGRTGLAVSVSDTGIGIPPRDVERVFERFYRVDRARSRETGGTGLGLSIVKHVAELHGGGVTVRSYEGSGSTFTFMLPA